MNIKIWEGQIMGTRHCRFRIFLKAVVQAFAFVFMSLFKEHEWGTKGKEKHIKKLKKREKI